MAERFEQEALAALRAYATAMRDGDVAGQLAFYSPEWHSEAGRTIAEVADILCKAYNTIKAWYGRFARRGPAGLDDAQRPGRPPKIKSQTPDGFLKRGRPTFPSVLAAEIMDAAVVEYTASACRRMLRKAGWSPKAPVPVHFRRAPAGEVREWQTGMKR